MKSKFYILFLLLMLFTHLYPQSIIYKNFDYPIQRNKSNFSQSQDLIKSILNSQKLSNKISNEPIKKMDSLITTAKPVYNGSTKITFEYNENEQLSNYYLYGLMNEEWHLYEKTMLSYDSKNLLTFRIVKYLKSGFWTNDIQEFYTYDGNGNEIQYLSQSWIDGGWSNHLRTSSNYDSLQNLNSRFSEKWKDSTWQNSHKSEYKYNENKQIIEARFSDFIDNRWHQTSFNHYYYNNFGYFDSLISQRWNGSYWINSMKYYPETLKYGQQINENFDIWYNNQWEKYTRVIYYYDRDGYFLHAHCEYWSGESWEPNMDGIHVYNPDGFEIHYLTHQMDIYYEKPTSVEDRKSNLIIDEYKLYQNYPNPFNPSTTIKYSIKDKGLVKLTVFNSLGEEINELVNEIQEKGNYSVKFNANKLSSGVYFYRISVNNYVAVKRMIFTK